MCAASDQSVSTTAPGMLTGMDPYEEFAPALQKQIRMELAERDMSQGELAAAAEIMPATLNRYLQGHRDFPIATLARIAQHFGMTTSELMGRAEARLARQRNAAAQH